jgi:hypothetical protein
MLTRHASLGRKSITLREQRHHVAKFPIDSGRVVAVSKAERMACRLSCSARAATARFRASRLGLHQPGLQRGLLGRLRPR